MSKPQIAQPVFRLAPDEISEKQRQGRAANAVADLLQRKLLVPKIYLGGEDVKIFFNPKYKNEKYPFASVVAVDRAGSGDIHGVRVLPGLPHILLEPGGMGASTLSHFILPIIKGKSDAFHFKYLAVASELVDLVSKQNLFAEDGIGRVGVIAISERPSGPPEARIVIPAERFRLAPDKVKRFDAFQKKTPADIEIRD